MSCLYCAIFQAIPEVLRKWDKSEENKRKSERYCSYFGDYVKNDSPECDGFVLSDKFWCRTDYCWMYVSACINRRRKKFCKKKCPQGKIIVSKMRGVKIETKTPLKEEKPSLNLHKKEPQKPTLNLRQR